MFIKEFGCTGLFPFSLVLFCFFIVFLSEKRAIAFVPGMIEFLSWLPDKYFGIIGRTGSDIRWEGYFVDVFFNKFFEDRKSVV